MTTRCKFALPGYELAAVALPGVGLPALPSLTVRRQPFPGAKMPPLPSYGFAPPSLPSAGLPALPAVGAPRLPFPGATMPPFGLSLVSVSLPTVGLPALPALPARPCALDAA